MVKGTESWDKGVFAEGGILKSFGLDETQPELQ